MPRLTLGRFKAAAIALIVGLTPLIVLTGEPHVPPDWARENGDWGAGAGDIRTREVSTGAVPRTDAPPTPVVWPAEQRVGELAERRTARTRVYMLSDGRLQEEISATPLHYQAADGSWQPIDTAVTASTRAGYEFGNQSNQFRSFFGTDVRFEIDAGSLTMTPPVAAKPSAEGATVRYALGEDTELRYEVTAEALKEKIVIASRPTQGGDVSFTFGLGLDGLGAKPAQDGSIAFFGAGDGPAALLMPRPFMMDSADDAASPYGKAWSPAVTQTLHGDALTVTADGKWLADPARKYPVIIDPTIKLAPTPTDSQDTMILSDSPTSNYDSSWRLSVGTTATGTARSLVKFPTPSIPSGTVIDSAQLQLYYDQHHDTNAQSVTVEAHRATAAWDETTATWNNANANVGELGANVSQVDDGDFWQHTINGAWPTTTGGDAAQGINGDYAYNRNATTGETYSWTPITTEPGDYRAEVHYVSGPDRPTNATYTVNYQGGSKAYTVNQTGTAGAGVWKTLGTHPFAAGTSGTVVLGDVSDASKTVVADAIRVVKDGIAVRPAGDQGSHWHSFSVRNIVQGWVNNAFPNYGFVLKAADEATRGMGGPRYEGSIYAYNGETAIYPRLVLTYGRPGVSVNPPTTIHSTGAELTWPAYVDPCGWCGPADDIAEYQVHRSVYQSFTPTAATLVAPVVADRLSYTDTTAVPTAADDADPFGSAYYYMVAVKTKDGGITPGPTRLVRLPKAGRITKLFQSGVVDTTLSSTLPDANQDRLSGQAWLSVGNTSTTYGRTRALVKFPVTGIPTTARITEATMSLWTAGLNGDGNATWELHGLTRDFTETEATWNRATAATPWTAAGGDFGTTTATRTTFTNDPKRQNFDATALATLWVVNPATNKGAELKVANESTPAAQAVFLSSEADEPELGPQLRVTYLDPEGTYYVPGTPPSVVPGTTTTIQATVTNTTGQPLPKTDWALSYRWSTSDGVPVSAPQVNTALPIDLATGDSVTVLAQVTAPPPAATGSPRVDHRLTWDLFNTKTGAWLSNSSAPQPVAGLAQELSVDDPTSDQIGLEKFYAYSGANTGAGASIMNNLHSGNAVWSYNAFNNPSRGLNTFLRLTYNSMDTSDAGAGFGFSVQASSVMRLGIPIDPQPRTFDPQPNQKPTKVTFTDGDGTTHTYTLDDKQNQDPNDDEWVNPHGVHLYLQRLVACKTKDEVTRAWVMTKPDRTQFYFDCDGYQTSVVDNNGNTLTFVYEQRKSNGFGKPLKFLRQIIDPNGRQTLAVDYYAKGDAYDFIDENTWVRTPDTNLTNPNIIDHIKQITDISGRALTFTYTPHGLLGELIDGAGLAQQKMFKLRYDMTVGMKNVKLVRVTDPRGNTTTIDYNTAQDNPKFLRATKSVTDRLNGVKRFAYSYPDTSQNVQAVVTDAENHATTQLTDGIGRPIQSTNAKNQVTKASWDNDNNLVRLEENNHAVTTLTYDQKTGYPLDIKDAEVNNNAKPGTVLTYQTGLNGHIAEMISKKSSEGRIWTFGYTAAGDLATVTDPAGNATTTVGDFTTTHTYDAFGQLASTKDANGNTTTFSDYDACGWPRTIAEPLGRTTTSAYDIRGNVTSVRDALGKTTTQTYDAFGRPGELRVPKDEASGVFIVTPAPEYDPNDNVIKTTAPNGAVTKSFPDAADQVSYVLAAPDTLNGPERRSSFTYDRVGNLTSLTEPNGNLTPLAGDFTTRYAYDEINELVSMTDAAGNRLSYTYDNVGNVSTVVDPRKNSTPDTGDFTQTIWHDLAHRVRAVFDALGKVTITDYDRDGFVVARTDKGGNKTLFTLDARGKPVEVAVPHENVGGTITYRTTRVEYDQVGNQTKVTAPKGVATAGVATDFVQETVYDALNQVKEQLTPFDPADGRYNKANKTTYSYDLAGHLTTVSAPPSEGETVRNDTTFTYFDNGWTKSTTDPWDITTFYDFNLIGKQAARVVTAVGNTTGRWMVWDYFPDGKLKSRTDFGVPVGDQAVLADNTDPLARTTGTWSTATTAANKQGRSYRTHPAGAGTDTFEWKLNVPQSGNYDVSVWYPTVSGASTATTYTVTTPAGTVTKPPIDQNQKAGTWVSLGTFAFTEGGAAKVSVAQNTTGTVTADAVRLVRDHSADADNESLNFGYGYDANGNLTSITDTSPHRRVDNYAITYTGLNQVAKVEEFRAGAVQNTSSFTYNANGAPETTTHDRDFARYEYDARDLVSKVTNGASATDPAKKDTTFTYTDRGERLRETKANGNTVDHTYFLDGLPATEVEKKADATTLVSQHTLAYDLNGNLTSDVTRKMNADNHGAYLDSTSTYTYDPLNRIAQLVRTGVGADTEKYVHDANNNVISQTIKNITTTYNYDRDRLTTSSTAGAGAAYHYDLFGRLTTVTAGDQVIERNLYDGFDHITEHRTITNGTTTTTRYTYDPLDRTATKTTDVGTAKQKTTDFNYLGLGNEVLDEDVAGVVTKSYQYSPMGERLSQITKNANGSTEFGYYGYNAHTDVDTVTDQSGNTKATYGYTAFGANNEAQFTGVDKPDPADPTKETYNAYRFNAKRWDSNAGSYDMGFRDYSPGLNRFITRDLYNGALSDMNLATNPFTGNRYAFGGGNPISSIELDGHIPDDCVSGRFTCHREDGHWNVTPKPPPPGPEFDFDKDVCVHNCRAIHAEASRKAEDCLDRGWGHSVGWLNSMVGNCYSWDYEHEIVRRIERQLRAEFLAENPDDEWMWDKDHGPQFPMEMGTFSSRRLGRNLEKAGYARQAGEQAHHIIAGGDKRADAARQVLEKFGIDIDAAENGVFLSRSVHATTFKDVYFDAVDDLILNVTSKEEAVSALNTIRNGLLNGTFPPIP